MTSLTLESIREAQRLIAQHALKGPTWDGMIRENSLLTISKARQRTWRERLFSWPWRPLQRMLTWQEPDPDVYRVRLDSFRETVFAHPATAQRIRATLARDESRQ